MKFAYVPRRDLNLHRPYSVILHCNCKCLNKNLSKTLFALFVIQKPKWSVNFALQIADREFRVFALGTQLTVVRLRGVILCNN